MWLRSKARLKWSSSWSLSRTCIWVTGWRASSSHLNLSPSGILANDTSYRLITRTSRQCPEAKTTARSRKPAKAQWSTHIAILVSRQNVTRPLTRHPWSRSPRGRARIWLVLGIECLRRRVERKEWHFRIRTSLGEDLSSRCHYLWGLTLSMILSSLNSTRLPTSITIFQKNRRK